MKRVFVLAISIILLLAMALPAIAAGAFPEVISLPLEFQPEGIALGTGHTFYAGSLADGAIWAGDLRSGETEELVPGESGRISVGMAFDDRSNFLFVAGGGNSVGRVYDTTSGSLLAEYPLTSNQPANFINDVIVTRQAAFFTNSFASVFYRVPLGSAGELPDPGDVTAISLSGEWVQSGGFNANGIVATPDGKTLMIVNSSAGAVFLVDPQTGVATEVALSEPVPFGDGLVLMGKTLYVVQNQLNQIGVVSLSANLSSGTVVDQITDPNFAIPTTALAFGDSLYAVNAKFGTPPTGTPYEVVKVSR